MSAIKQVFTETYKAATAITAGQAVKFTANENEVTPTTGTTDKPCGVALEDQPTAGEGVVVLHLGEAWVNTSAAVAVGGYLFATATVGAVDDAVIGAGSTWYVGIALSAIGAAGQVRCLVLPGLASAGIT